MNIVDYTPEAALLVTPHPDDAEGGCGGTIGRWISEGAKGYYVLCTNGDKGSGDPEMTRERLAVIREREQQEAADVMGVTEVTFLRIPDGTLEDNHDFRKGGRAGYTQVPARCGDVHRSVALQVPHPPRPSHERTGDP